MANYGSFETAAALKFLSLYTFYIAGRSAPGRLRPAEKWCIYALAVLPFMFKMAGETKIYVGFEFPDVFAYFPTQTPQRCILLLYAFPYRRGSATRFWYCSSSMLR